MRRALALVSVAALSVGGLVLSSPALAAPDSRASDTAHEAVPDELLVAYVSGASAADKDRARGRASARFADQVVRAGADRLEVELVRLPSGKNRAQAEAELEADPEVAYAEPNWVVQHAATATDPYFTDGSLWGMGGGFGSNAATAWQAGRTGSSSVYVGVIDEGIQYTHPDLDANIGSNPGEADGAPGVDDDKNGYVDDTRGWDFANNDSTIYDGGTKGNADDHGTHVAGTLGAESNASGVVGVNWNVKLLSGKFLGRNGGSIANAIKATDYFTDLKTRHGLNLVATNNSCGGGGYSQAMKDAISRANAANILFVAAAGNGGRDGVGDNNDTTASYPSNYDVPNVIAVAAITSTGAKSSFSNYGATTVDLGAPGSGIWSTTALNGYSSYNGTSMATPHVTGAAALYASTHPGATAAQIKEAILGSALSTPSMAGKTVTGGRLNVSGF